MADAATAQLAPIQRIAELIHHTTCHSDHPALHCNWTHEGWDGRLHLEYLEKAKQVIAAANGHSAVAIAILQALR